MELIVERAELGCGIVLCVPEKTQNDTDSLNGRAVLTPEDLDRWQQHTATSVYHYHISDQHRLGSELCCVSLSLASLRADLTYFLT